MLSPVIPYFTEGEEKKQVHFVAQSPDHSGHYPVNPSINTDLNGSFVYYYGNLDELVDGLIQIELNYSQGLLEGPVKIFTNDGNVYCEGQYASNKKTGKWKFYSSNGIVLETGDYEPSSDKSFEVCDRMIEPFLTPSYTEYEIDTEAYWEVKSAHIIPLLNVGYNRETGRVGNWFFYNDSGALIDEKKY